MKTILIMAQTVDGKVAKYSGHDSDWTGSYDKKYFADLTKKSGVVIMGSKTFDVIGKHLPGRYNVIMTRDKTRSYLEYSGSESFAFSRLSPDIILKLLSIFGYESACIIGGPTINTLFAKAGLIDEVHVTISPLMFGSGLSMFTEQVDMPLAFKKRELFEDGSMVLVYDVIKVGLSPEIEA